MRFHLPASLNDLKTVRIRSGDTTDLFFVVAVFLVSALEAWAVLAALALACTAYAWLSRSRSVVLTGCLAASGLILLWNMAWPLLWAYTPALRSGGVAVALLFPSCMAVPLVILAVSRPWMALIVGASLLLAAAVFCSLLSSYAFSSGMPLSSMADMLFLARISLLAAATGAAVFCRGRREMREGMAGPAFAFGVACCISAGILFVSQNVRAGKPATDSARVAVWCDSFHEGRFVPIRESPVGLSNVGLFGEVAPLLKSYGFRVGALASLGKINVRDWDVLFLLLPPKPMSECEREAVKSFVSSGGCLVIAAEHTDMDSNAAFYNPLLAGYGFRILFDTTTSTCGDTVAGTSSSPDALGRLFRNGSRLAYNRGASLELHGRARPVLLGEWWWSDAGDSNAVEKAQMGDEAWSPGDAFGRSVLVGAARCPGGGEVVVFADTSPFISRNIVYNGRFIAEFFGLLTGTRISHTAVLRRQLLISTEENNDLPLQGFDADAPTGLGVAALRAGLGVQIGGWRDIRAGDVLVIANPRRVIDLERLMKHVEGGGTALVCGSGADRHFLTLVESLGCSVGRSPLGPVSEKLSALEAWELRVPDGAKNVSPLKAQGKTIGGIFMAGGGRLFVVCDRFFISSRNIEKEGGINEPNAHFMSVLFGPGPAPAGGGAD